MRHRWPSSAGGASAALLLAQLARRPGASALHVDVYDRDGRFGRGLAYSAAHDVHLLNVRAAHLSALQDERGDFAAWAQARGHGPADFVPRKQYGDYLAEQVARAQQRLRVRFLEEDVQSSRREGEAYVLSTAQGARRYAQVVLASGNVRALRPRLQGRVAGYVDDPWRADLAVLLRARQIGLIGSGLTAVDMVLALEAGGYRGEVTVFSRHGLLPAAHVAPAAHPPFLTAADARLPPRRLLRLIRAEVRRADVPWQAVIDSLRPLTNAIWTGWSDAERRQFTRRLLTFWNVHRHRMAPQLAAQVQRLREAGRLHLVKGPVREVGPGPTVVGVGGAHRMDAVINCLGYRHDEAGRAFEVSARLGPARSGELFETTAIPEIREQAHALAGRLLPGMGGFEGPLVESGAHRG